MKIKFVVDSASDIPDAYIQQHGIMVVPMFVNYGGKSYADDGVALDRNNYYDMLETLDELPKTAAPSAGLAQEIIETAFEDTDHLIIVSIVAALSGSHNAMRLGAANLPADRVTLIDSGQLSMGAGWQAIIGAEVAERTKDLSATLDAIARVRQNQTVYAAMETVDYLRKGGRVSWAKAAIGSLLKIRPIVRVGDGAVKSAAQVRRRRDWIDRVAKYLRDEAPLDRVALLHTNNLEDVSTIKDMLTDILPENVITVLATPAIGTHTGPRGIGFASVRQTWKE